MTKNRYKFTIPNSERNKHHLVVSPETHDVVKHYAEKWGISITEATQRLLLNSITKELKKDE